MLTEASKDWHSSERITEVANTEEFFVLAHRYIVIMLGPSTSYVSSIHVADAVAAGSASRNL